MVGLSRLFKIYNISLILVFDKKNRVNTTMIMVND